MSTSAVNTSRVATAISSSDTPDEPAGSAPAVPGTAQAPRADAAQVDRDARQGAETRRQLGAETTPHQQKESGEASSPGPDSSGPAMDYSKVFKPERFLGESRAMEFLEKNGCNNKKAWEDLQSHRKSYPGLKEEDRNGEHYLYARWKVSEGPSTRQFVAFHLMTPGYHAVKYWSNALLGDWSPYRGSPPTPDELMSGHFGANDGYFTAKKSDPCGK